MKKTVHIILGAFLRSVWIGALLFAVLLIITDMDMWWVIPDYSITPMMWAAMATALFLWFVGLIHDLTS